MSEPDYKLWGIFVRFLTEIVDYAVKEGVESKEAFKQTAAVLRQKIEEGIREAEEVAAHEEASKPKRCCELCGKVADASDPHVCKDCYSKIWDLCCLKCDWDCHLADYGYEVVKVGDIIHITCHECKATWWKIVGEEHGVKIIRDRHKRLVQKAKEASL